MLSECWLDLRWQHGHAIFLPFPVADKEFAAREVDVLHTQLESLEQTQTSTVEQRAHQPYFAVEQSQHRLDLLTRQYHRQTLWLFRSDGSTNFTEIDMQYLLVEKEQCVEGLILRRSGNVGFESKVAEKLSNLVHAHFGRMTLTVKENVTSNPANVGILGLRAIVFHTDRFANLVQQLGLVRMALGCVHDGFSNGKGVGNITDRRHGDSCEGK